MNKLLTDIQQFDPMAPVRVLMEDPAWILSEHADMWQEASSSHTTEALKWMLTQNWTHELFHVYDGLMLSHSVVQNLLKTALTVGCTRDVLWDVVQQCGQHIPSATWLQMAVATQVALNSQIPVKEGKTLVGMAIDRANVGDLGEVFNVLAWNSQQERTMVRRIVAADDAAGIESVMDHWQSIVRLRQMDERDKENCALMGEYSFVPEFAVVASACAFQLHKATVDQHPNCVEQLMWAKVLCAHTNAKTVRAVLANTDNGIVDALLPALRDEVQEEVVHWQEFDGHLHAESIRVHGTLTAAVAQAYESNKCKDKKKF